MYTLYMTWLHGSTDIVTQPLDGIHVGSMPWIRLTSQMPAVPEAQRPHVAPVKATSPRKAWLKSSSCKVMSNYLIPIAVYYKIIYIYYINQLRIYKLSDLKVRNHVYQYILKVDTRLISANKNIPLVLVGMVFPRLNWPRSRSTFCIPDLCLTCR